MLINLRDITDDGLDLRYKENPKSLSLDEYISDDIIIYAHIVKDADSILINGSIEARLEMKCSRCLKRFSIAINPDFNVDYVPVPDYAEEAEFELKKADLEIGFYSGETLDLDELIREQIVLSIPMQPLCTASCKGICPVCGQDLNLNTCGCSRDIINPQFAGLKDLLKKG